MRACTKKSGLALLLFAYFVTAAQAQQQSYTFKSNAELVLVNVGVRDKSGRFVRNLKAEDFRLL